MIKYSIIIPHKNRYDLLIGLLSTIPNEPSIQILVIDDKSAKDVIENLNKTNFNTNVNVIYDESGKGAGHARNIGLANAHGKWVIFADSDDYFCPNLSEILDKYYDSEADIIYFNTTSVILNTAEMSFRHIPFNNLVNSYLKNNSKNNQEKLTYGFTVPWGKFLKRELIKKNNILFDEVIASNDVFFSVKTGYYALCILGCNEVLYVATSSKDSLTTTMNRDIFLSRFNVILNTNRFLKHSNKRNYQLSIIYYLFFSYKYGFDTFLYCVKKTFEFRNNPFIGANKILRFRKIVTLKDGKF